MRPSCSSRSSQPRRAVASATGRVVLHQVARLRHLGHHRARHQLGEPATGLERDPGCPRHPRGSGPGGRGRRGRCSFSSRSGEVVVGDLPVERRPGPSAGPRLHERVEAPRQPARGGWRCRRTRGRSRRGCRPGAGPAPAGGPGRTGRTASRSAGWRRRRPGRGRRTSRPRRGARAARPARRGRAPRPAGGRAPSGRAAPSTPGACTSAATRWSGSIDERP